MKVKLPELPPIGVNSYGYGGYEMEAYGRACYLAALEAAAKVCEAQEYSYWRSTENQDFTPQDCADAIRAIQVG